MSFHTFLNEFYPTDAHDCKTDLEAVRHGKQKWSGRLPENLAKHEVEIHPLKPKYIVTIEPNQNNVFPELYSANTCALCIPRTAPHKFIKFIKCTTCPIKLATGTTCDEPRTDSTSLYRMALDNPQVMLDALDKAEAYLLAQEPSK